MRMLRRAPSIFGYHKAAPRAVAAGASRAEARPHLINRYFAARSASVSR
jgi:hypothetical protein